MKVSENPWLLMALNNAWANATLYSAVSALPPDAFAANRPGYFPSLARTLNHIYEVDLYYLDALEGGGLGRSVYERADILDPARLTKVQSEADRRFAVYCRDLVPDRLDTMCRTERKDGNVEEPVAALILHLVQHQIHHRGQAHVQLSDAGVAPPQLDDFFLEYGRALTAEDYWTEARRPSRPA